MTVREVNGISPTEDRLETGLLNFWYLVADASWITQEPVGLKRLNQNIVLQYHQTNKHYLYIVVIVYLLLYVFFILLLS